MLDIPLFQSESPAAVRQPTFAIAFGGGAGGGLGGLAASAGSALGIGGAGGDSWQQHLVSLRVELGLAPFVDVVELVVATGAQTPTVAVGDEGTVALGYGDADTTLVFTGRVARISYGMGIRTVTVTNGGAQLAQLRLNQSYEQQSAGEIVTELTGAAEVSTDIVENGVDFPFYVVADGRSAYQQIAELARKSDYGAWITAAGKLTFAPLDEGDPVATFTYGENILSLQINDAAPTVGAIMTVGEGAAGSQGSNAWPWLVKDPSAVTGSTGAATPARLVQDGALRSGAATQSVADSVSKAADRLKITGRLLAPGAPTVIPASTIAVANAPTDLANGNFLVQRVRHHFSKDMGFTTSIVFSKIGGLI